MSARLTGVALRTARRMPQSFRISASFSTYQGHQSFTNNRTAFGTALGVASGISLFAFYQVEAEEKKEAKVDLDAIKKDIVNILDNFDYDDGSYGPVLMRLAWHSSGTFDKKTNTGGSNGAGMRFKPESEWGANAGLAVARGVLEPIKKKHPEISYSDLWVYAGYVALESMGGPKIPFRLGRKDHVQEKLVQLPDGLLPDATQGAQHLRDIFGRMGFNDQEIVALSGAHGLGRCHPDRSGFEGPWTRAPTTFSNEFFRVLLEEKWVPAKAPNGATQYWDGKTKSIMMLPTDLVLVQDPKFKEWVEKYNKDEKLFFDHFAAAFNKLTELGFPAAQSTSQDAPKSKSFWSKITGK